MSTVIQVEENIHVIPMLCPRSVALLHDFFDISSGQISDVPHDIQEILINLRMAEHSKKRVKLQNKRHSLVRHLKNGMLQKEELNESPA